MVEREQVYNVPLIPFDLRRDETILQFTDALEYLSNVSNDIFQRVGERERENRKQLESLIARIKTAEGKIEKVRGSNKATQVFSSSKYPAPEELEKFTSLFRDVEDSLKEVKRSYRKMKTKHSAFEEDSLKSKMQFYNVQKPRSRSSASADQSGEGLGGLPSNIESLSSLLLFNSSENPYKKYTIFDPLGATTKTRTALEEEDAAQNGLGDAPMSISNREQMERHVAENYFYIPDLGDVPEINVPMDLPDLPGIADLAFSSDIDESIAPSLLAISNLPDLPGVGETPTSTDAPPPPEPSTNNVPPPPPPPPVSHAPPPPPPPPSTAPPTSSPASVPTEVAKPDTGRSDLLDSIRKAGGVGQVKLKSGKDRKLQKKKEKEAAQISASSSSGGGDLMSDLFHKLTMRRKGISGSKGASSERPNNNNNNDRTGGGSAMDKISSMIPPPSNPGPQHNADDDDDWK